MKHHCAPLFCFVATDNCQWSYLTTVIQFIRLKIFTRLEHEWWSIIGFGQDKTIPERWFLQLCHIWKSRMMLFFCYQKILLYLDEWCFALKTWSRSWVNIFLAISEPDQADTILRLECAAKKIFRVFFGAISISSKRQNRNSIFRWRTRN